MARRFAARQMGQGLVEFAVIFPIFAFLLFGIIDGGLLMGRYNNINNAAKEGARLGAVGATQDEIVDRVRAQVHGDMDDTAGHPLSTSCTDYASPPANTNVICVQWIKGPFDEAPGSFGSSLRVKIKYRYHFLSPLGNLAGASWTVTACSIQRMERPADTVGSTSDENSCDGSSGGALPSPTPRPVTNTPVPPPTNTPVPTNTPKHPTNTPAPATSTPAPPTPNPTVCNNGGNNCH